MLLRRWQNWFWSLALIAAAAWATLPSAAAYCATCYLGAADAGDKAIQALRLGIIVLAIPTATILGGILFYAFRYRDSAVLPERQSQEELLGNRWKERWGKTARFLTARISLSAVKLH